MTYYGAEINVTLIRYLTRQFQEAAGETKEDLRNAIRRICKVVEAYCYSHAEFDLAILQSVRKSLAVIE